jgi:hypothetical protein
MKTIELIEAVRALDSKAADYIENEAKELTSYADSDTNTLASIFAWRDTPQGEEFWININNKID